MNRELGPRTLGDIINETFSLYGKGLWTFVAIVIIPEVIVFVLGAIIVIPLIFVSAMGSVVDFSPFSFDYDFELGVGLALVLD